MQMGFQTGFQGGFNVGSEFAYRSPGRVTVKSMVLVRHLALLAALAAGCGAPGEGGVDGGTMPSGSEVSIQFVLHSGNADLGRLPAAAGDLSLEGVSFSLARLSLSGDGSYGDGDQRDGKLLDLTNGPVTLPPMGALPALYSRMRVDFDAPDGDHDGRGGSDASAASFQVSGKTAAGVPFVVRGRDEVRLELRAVDGAELGAHTMLVCVVRFNVDQWFQGLPPEHATDGDGLRHFEDNLARSAALTVSAVLRD
jgi:hypothetical protein